MCFSYNGRVRIHGFINVISIYTLIFFSFFLTPKAEGELVEIFQLEDPLLKVKFLSMYGKLTKKILEKYIWPLQVAPKCDYFNVVSLKDTSIQGLMNFAPERPPARVMVNIVNFSYFFVFY